MRIAYTLPSIAIRTIFSTAGLLVFLTACGGGGSGNSTPTVPTSNSLKLDTTYGAGGTAQVNWPVPSALVLQSDGKLILTGSRQTAPLPAGSWTGRTAREVFAIRLTANGALDTTFGTNGEVKISVLGSDTPSDIKLQKNGRILVAVNAAQPCSVQEHSLTAPCLTSVGSNAKYSSQLIALTHEGAIDKTFGESGVASTAASRNPESLSLAVQSDQRIFLLRSTGYELKGLSEYGRVLDMFSADGVLAQKNTTGNSASECLASGTSLLIQNSGRIVSAGTRGGTTYTDPAEHPGVCIATHSQHTGEQTSNTWTKLGGNLGFRSLQPTSEGGFMSIGTVCDANNDNCQLGVARYGTAGTLQSSFGNNGIGKIGLPARTNLQSAVPLPDDSLMVLGSRVVYGENFSNPQAGAVWVRMKANGSADTDFGTGGVFTGPLSNQSPIRLLPDSQGRWLMVSYDALTAGPTSFQIQRLSGWSQP